MRHSFLLAALLTASKLANAQTSQEPPAVCQAPEIAQQAFAAFQEKHGYPSPRAAIYGYGDAVDGTRLFRAEFTDICAEEGKPAQPHVEHNGLRYHASPLPRVSCYVENPTFPVNGFTCPQAADDDDKPGHHAVRICDRATLDRVATLGLPPIEGGMVLTPVNGPAILLNHGTERTITTSFLHVQNDHVKPDDLYVPGEQVVQAGSDMRITLKGLSVCVIQ